MQKMLQFGIMIKRDGLGDEFLLALEATLNSIQRNPDHFQVIHKGLKRALTVRFPYGVFFTVEDNIIYVLAIVHTSRIGHLPKN